MPALVPGVQPFAAFGGTYTLSSDQETMTIGASPAETVITPWYDVATTLARVSWDGTATGTIRGRTSASRPASTDDLCPIQPGDSEWAYKFDAALGTAPTSQGWSKSGSITETVVAGGMRLQGAGGAYYYINPATLLPQSSDLLVIRLGLTLNSGHAGNFQLLHINGSKSHSLLWTGSAYGSDANKLQIGSLNYATGFTATADTAIDYLIVVRRSSGANLSARVYAKARGSGDRYTLAGLSDLGEMPTPSDAQNFLIWGCLGGSGFDVTVDHLGAFSGTEWETVTDGDTSFGRNQRYWQVKGWASGTLTEFDLAADLSAPSAPSAPTAADVGSDGIAATWASVAGAAAYYVETYNTGTAAVADAEWYLRTAAATSGLAAGTYRFNVYAASDDGVRSVTAGQSNTVTLPVAAATAPTIGPYPRWVSGELRFYKPAAGSSSLTGGTYKILSAAQAYGAYSVADTTSWASLSWRATDGTGEYVTADDLGLTVGSTTWYRDRITDSGGLVAEGQTAVYGGDTASSLCVVSLDFGADYASKTVVATLSNLCTVRGQSFTRQPYTVTLDGSGVGVITLPRTEAATITDGGTGVPYMTFAYANIVEYKVIPDSASATYASLDQPG